MLFYHRLTPPLSIRFHLERYGVAHTNKSTNLVTPGSLLPVSDSAAFCLLPCSPRVPRGFGGSQRPWLFIFRLNDTFVYGQTQQHCLYFLNWNDLHLLCLLVPDPQCVRKGRFFPRRSALCRHSTRSANCSRNQI